jgi:competence protein ComEC
MANPVATGTLRVVVSCLAGLLLYFTIGGGFPYAGEAAAFFVVIFLVFWWRARKRPLARRRRWAGATGLLALTALSIWVCFQKNTLKTLPVAPGQITHYKVTLVKAVALKPTSVNTVGRLVAVRAKGKWYPGQGQVALFFPHSPAADALQYGQQLLVAGALVPPAGPANPYQFDYQRYLALKRVQWQAYLTPDKWQAVGYAPPSQVVALSLRVRKQLERAFKEVIDTPREVAISQALILGVQDDLDATLRNAFARTGTMHVLAVSGLHVGLLYGVLLFLLKPLRRGKTSGMVAVLVILGVIWFYAFVTGMSTSVLRSVCMFTLVEVGKLLRRKASVLNTLAVVAVALLLYDPLFLFDVGFQLSFLAVAGIVLLQPLFLNHWRPETKVVRWVWELLAISVAAQLATFPLSLYYFHQFPVYFWLANLVAVPATSLGLYLGIGFMLLFWVPYLGPVIGWFLKWTLWLLNELLLWLETWPHAVLDGFVVTPSQVMALYLVLIFGVLFLVQKRLGWLAGSVLCLAFFTGTVMSQAHRQGRTKELVVHSVRKSSAVSLVNGRQVTFLADSAFHANATSFAYQVQPYWWAKGVRDTLRFRPDFQKTGLKQKTPFHRTAEGNKVLVWRGKKLLWLKRLPNDLARPVALDALVLQQNVWLPLDRLQTTFLTKTIVLDQTNARWYVQRKAPELRAAGYQVHVLEEQGAWQIRL